MVITEELIGYLRHNPYAFIEEFYGIKLSWYQKLIIRMTWAG